MNAPYRNEDAAIRSHEQVDFSFGENWRKFVAGVDDQKIQQAISSMRRSFAPYSLAGEEVLDLGCGSGLFSFAAQMLGAGRVKSFDIDPNCCAASRMMYIRANSPENWEIRQGSILDPAFVSSIKPASRVYSYGVVHYSGAMWRAFDATLSLVAPDGICCIALYDRPRHISLSRALKRFYNRLPRMLRPAAVYVYGSLILARRTQRTHENPVKFVARYGKFGGRGMDFWRDVEGWLGGLPWEFASEGEVKSFVQARGFEVINVIRGGSGGNNEYLLRKRE